jgi:hypothetical protein
VFSFSHVWEDLAFQRGAKNEKKINGDIHTAGKFVEMHLEGGQCEKLLQDQHK